MATTTTFDPEFLTAISLMILTIIGIMYKALTGKKPHESHPVA